MANEHCCGIDGHRKYPQCDNYDPEAKCIICKRGRKSHSSLKDATVVLCNWTVDKQSVFTSEGNDPNFDDGSEEFVD